MTKAILVVNGLGGPGTFSIPDVVTINPADNPLSFADAKAYIDSDKSIPEYASIRFGEYGSLSDSDCMSVLGKVVSGNGIVSTGIHKGGNMNGPLVYVLRGANYFTSDDITVFINSNGISQLVLLACTN